MSALSDEYAAALRFAGSGGARLPFAVGTELDADFTAEMWVRAPEHQPAGSSSSVTLLAREAHLPNGAARRVREQVWTARRLLLGSPV